MNDIEVIFFDLFYTLVEPNYGSSKNEYDIFKLDKFEWEKLSEDSELYYERATGKVNNPREIIKAIITKADLKLDENMIQEVLELRTCRFKYAILDIDDRIVDTLLLLKSKGKKLCVISNVDVIDVMHWQESPLYKIFDDAIFSYEVGYLKPDKEIYRFALDKMNVEAKHSLFVGDGGSSELEGAKSIGMKTVLSDYLLDRELDNLLEVKRHADYYIKEFEELIDIIENL